MSMTPSDKSGRSIFLSHRYKWNEVCQRCRIATNNLRWAPEAAQNELLIHVAVEMKTATAAKIIEWARASLRSLQSYEQATKFLCSCQYDDDMYKSIVPSNHRIKLLHHVSVLGLRACLYVKSCRNGIICAVFCFLFKNGPLNVHRGPGAHCCTPLNLLV